MSLGSGIRNKPIPDPGSGGQKGPNPGSGSATLRKTAKTLIGQGRHSTAIQHFFVCLLKRRGYIFYTGAQQCVSNREYLSSFRAFWNMRKSSHCCSPPLIFYSAQFSEGNLKNSLETKYLGRHDHSKIFILKHPKIYVFIFIDTVKKTLM